MAKKIMTLEERRDFTDSIREKSIDELKELISSNYKRVCDLGGLCQKLPDKTREHKTAYTLYKFCLEKNEILLKELESAYFVAYAK